MCRIGIVEDHAVTVAGIREILREQTEVEVVASAPTVIGLFEQTTDVDLVVLDLRLPDGSSPVGNVHDIRAAGVDRILVFTSGDEPFLVRMAARAGVLGVIRKSEHDHVVAAAILQAARGELVPTMDWASTIDDDEDFVECRLP